MDIAKLKELLAAATPGPWEVEDGDSLVNRGLGDEYDPVGDDFHRQPSWDIGQVYAPQNRALIVAAVNALPSLIARVEAAEKVAAEMTDFVEQEAEVWLDTVDAWRCRLNPAYSQEKARG